MQKNFTKGLFECARYLQHGKTILSYCRGNQSCQSCYYSYVVKIPGWEYARLCKPLPRQVTLWYGKPKAQEESVFSRDQLIIPGEAVSYYSYYELRKYLLPFEVLKGKCGGPEDLVWNATHGGNNAPISSKAEKLCYDANKVRKDVEAELSWQFTTPWFKPAQIN